MRRPHSAVQSQCFGLQYNPTHAGLLGTHQNACHLAPLAGESPRVRLSLTVLAPRAGRWRAWLRWVCTQSLREFISSIIR
jgi:hypothetical protein